MFSQTKWQSVHHRGLTSNKAKSQKYDNHYVENGGNKDCTRSISLLYFSFIYEPEMLVKTSLAPTSANSGTWAKNDIVDALKVSPARSCDTPPVDAKFFLR